MLNVEGCSKTGRFRDISNHIFGNLKDTWAVTVIFFSKCSKLNLDSRKAAKNLEKVFSFLHNCTWIDCGKFSLLGREYLSSAVKMLKNSAKIQYITKRDILHHNFLKSDEKIWWKCCRADFRSVWATLACWLSSGVLKRGLLDICLTTSFEIRNFGNT